MSRGRNRDGQLGVVTPGVVWGLYYPKPASGLTATYLAGLVRVGQASPAGSVKEYRIAGTTKLFTASKDTYVSVTTAGALQYTEVANAAAKPSQATIGALSEWVAKVVTDATDITSVTDLRRQASADIELLGPVEADFGTTALTTHRIPVHRSLRVVAIESIVAVALHATDAGAVTASKIDRDNAATAMTNGATSHALSSAVGNRQVAVPTAANYLAPGEQIALVATKTSKGGRALTYAVVEYLD